jgi:hypothetical protein
VTRAQAATQNSNALSKQFFELQELRGPVLTAPAFVGLIAKDVLVVDMAQQGVSFRNHGL